MTQTNPPISDQSALLPKWRETLSQGLASPNLPSQRRLFEELNPQAEGTPFMEQRRARPQKPASVMIPIIERAEGPQVLFMLRSSEMPSHPGQISFPGGKVHPEDKTRLETALRETEEEIGVTHKEICVLGQLGEHFGGQGYRVTPFIGALSDETRFTPCPREVDRLFEVPLAHLIDLNAHIPEAQEFAGHSYQMFAVRFKNWRIWGLTAGIIHTLALAWREGEKNITEKASL